METLQTKDVRKTLRLRNIQNLLDIFLQKEEVARVELSYLTGLTKTAITSLTKDLIEKGIIEEKSSVGNKAGVGRNMIPLKIKKDAAHVIGIKLLRDRLSGLLLNAHGEVLYKKDGSHYDTISAYKIIELLFNIIDDIFSHTDERINAIGIGMPGPLNVLTGTVMDVPKFPEWKDIPLANIVSEHYRGIPVWIENDGNCAAIAEKWYGKGKNLNTFLYVLLDDGIGGGIIFNGKIYKSPVGYEVEIGHSVVRKNKEVGFLEDFCEFSKIKDPLALRGLKRLREVGTLIGEVIATISNIIGPEKIFVGGKMAVLGDDLLNPIKESFDKFSFGERTNRYIPIEVSGIDEDAISIGAAIYVIRKYIIRKIADEIS